MLAYRVFFAVPDAGDLHAAVTHYLHAWLCTEGLATERLGDGAPRRLGEGVSGSSLVLTGPGGARTVRTRVIDEREGRQRTTQLTAHTTVDAGATGWVWLEVQAAEKEPLNETPPLVGTLLEGLAAQDGSLPLSSTPRVLVGPPQVDSLLDALTAPGRRALVLVAGCDESGDLAAVSDHLAPLLASAPGLTTGYVLDPEAMALLAATAGTDHAVAPGTVRAFQPGTLLGDRADGLRHQTLALPAGGHVSATLTATVRRRAVDLALRTPLPVAVRDVDRPMQAAWDERLLARARAPRRPPIDEVVEIPGAPTAPVEQRDPRERRTRRAFDALLVDLTGRPRLTGEAVSTLASLVAERRAEQATSPVRDAALDELAARIADLESRLERESTARAEAVRAHEDEQVERALADQERADAQRHLRHLQLRCARDDADASVWTVPEPEVADTVPSSLGELLARLRARELPHVVFTGAESVTASLDEHDLAGTAARKAWEAMLALNDYAARSLAGECPTDVMGYLQRTPPGCRGFSAARHARNESDEVRGNRRFASVRTLPVPTEVDPSGRVGMWAHFKLTTSGTTSPRLHYHDASATTGAVYVGYIGPHLPNGQTN